MKRVVTIMWTKSVSFIRLRNKHNNYKYVRNFISNFYRYKSKRIQSLISDDAYFWKILYSFFPSVTYGKRNVFNLEKIKRRITFYLYADFEPFTRNGRRCSGTTRYTLHARL